MHQFISYVDIQVDNTIHMALTINQILVMNIIYSINNGDIKII